MLLQAVIQIWYITVSHQITTLKLKHSQHLKKKADMDTQALQETDTNSTEEAKVSDDSEYTTDDDSDNKDQSDSEDNNEWNGLDEGTNEAANEASGDTVDNRITICIDPGHGGSNEGTKENYDGTLIKEKNITMTIARKLKILS